jgi:hypothetical protein
MGSLGGLGVGVTGSLRGVGGGGDCVATGFVSIRIKLAGEVVCTPEVLPSNVIHVSHQKYRVFGAMRVVLAEQLTWLAWLGRPSVQLATTAPPEGSPASLGVGAVETQTYPTGGFVKLEVFVGTSVPSRLTTKVIAPGDAIWPNP